MGVPNRSETPQQRIDAMANNTPGITVVGSGANAAAMRIVGEGRIPYGNFVLDEEEGGMTFAQDDVQRTGPVMIDKIPHYPKQSSPPHASFAEHLETDLNPQPLDGTFEEDQLKRTGPTLQ